MTNCCHESITPVILSGMRFVEHPKMISWEDRITLDPKVLVGKPVVKGTRLAVEFIVERLADGWSEQQLLDNYPGLTHEDISACLHYASEILKSERVYLTTK